MTDATLASDGTSRCVSCSTELAPRALACPSCQTLVHTSLLKQLAAQAEQFAAANDLIAARDTWSRALTLLPNGTQQYAAIRAHISALNNTIINQPSPSPAKPVDPSAPAWKRGLAGGGALLLLAASKLKFLILGLSKMSTLFSMIAFFGVYWTRFGWPLALGLVLSIYIHEMGHVAELKRLGIQAGAPLFIPGIGALVRLRQHVDDPVVDARIGLAGPIWGLGAGVAAWFAGVATGNHIWFAIAQLTGWINLFNLIPVWQLDGSRGFHALDRKGRWTVAVAAAALYAVTQSPMLVIIAAVGAFRAFQQTSVRTDARTLTTFLILLATLSGLAALNVPNL